MKITSLLITRTIKDARFITHRPMEVKPRSWRTRPRPSGWYDGGFPLPTSGYINTHPPFAVSGTVAAKMRGRTATRSRTRSRRSRRRVRRFTRVRSVGIPNSMVRKLRVCVNNVLDPGAGTISTFIMKINSIYDPLGDISGTQQPLYADQMSALYRKYCVVGWKVKCEAATADNTSPIVFGMNVTTQSTALTTYAHYKELGSTCSRLVTPDQDKCYLSMKGGTKRYLLPRGGKLLSDDECTALTSADPSKLLYLHIWNQAADGATDIGTTRFTLVLEQVVVFFDRVIPARSTQ